MDPFSSRILLAGSYFSEVENISTNGLKNDAVPSYQRYAHCIHSMLYSRRQNLTYFSIFWYSYLLLPSDLQALLKVFGTKWMDKLLQKLFDSFCTCCQYAVLWNFIIYVDFRNDCHNQNSEWLGYHNLQYLQTLWGIFCAY